jgi:hypothetical protein
MIAKAFAVLKESVDLWTMTLEALIAHNTEVSDLRRQAGDPLRQEIKAYMLDVNAWITHRTNEQQAAIMADPARVRRMQTISPKGIASSGDFDRLVLTAARKKARK